MFNRKRFATVLAAVVAVAAIGPAQAAKVGNVVFFGDSLSDTGNIWYATNGFPTLPYNQGTLGAGPDKTGGQWSDQLGPSWSTVFAKKFGLLATPSLVGGNNYAWGGARTGVNANPAAAPWLNQQVGQYLFGNAPTNQTLLTVMMGGNDVANNLGNVAALQAGIASIVGSLNSLYAAGGRQFLVANVPDIGATPTFQDLDQDNPGTAAFATFWTHAVERGARRRAGQPEPAGCESLAARPLRARQGPEAAGRLREHHGRLPDEHQPVRGPEHLLLLGLVPPHVDHARCDRQVRGAGDRRARAGRAGADAAGPGWPRGLGPPPHARLIANPWHRTAGAALRPAVRSGR